MAEMVTGMVILFWIVALAGCLLLAWRWWKAPEWRRRMSRDTGNPDWLKKGHWK